MQGPCEIWLDDKMVLHDDDCEKIFGTADHMTQKSILKPIDYSSCSASGCVYRFYWIAFQGSNNGYVRQIYRHCVPLTGPPAGQSSTAKTISGPGASNTTQASSDTPASKASTLSTEAATPVVTDAAAAGTPDPAAANQTPVTHPATKERCKAPRKRV
ncbi:hypothetical protein GN958_ATG10326 [Phytophthora infestans]|uniref:Uncharacterized protein n=1 Tax=Phytophthora infestans TaxID=4787 RepID=A0A8S9UIZ0_PHYIN|nr:hypothetical protein GN958_ATG10326 [Phytophthora infestans]